MPAIDRFALLLTVTFLLVFGVIAAATLLRVRRWMADQQTTISSVRAKVVEKHVRVSRPAGGPRPVSNHARRYYAAFQTVKGQRMEFSVSPEDYAALTEQDPGILTYQGPHFLGFSRN